MPHHSMHRTPSTTAKGSTTHSSTLLAILQCTMRLVATSTTATLPPRKKRRLTQDIYNPLYVAHPYPHVAQQQHYLGHAHQQQGYHNLAITAFEEAVRITQQSLGNNHPHVAQQQHCLGHAHQQQGRHDLAITAFEEAVRITQQSLGNNHPHVAHQQQGLHNLVITAFEEAVHITQQSLGNNHPHVAHQQQGRHDLVITAFEEAEQIATIPPPPLSMLRGSPASPSGKEEGRICMCKECKLLLLP